MKAKAKAAAKTAKRAAPPARKASSSKAPPARKVAPRREPEQIDIEDEEGMMQSRPADDGGEEGVLDLRACLAGCPTEAITECLLDELAKRVDYLLKSKEELPEEIADLWVNLKTMERTITDVRRALDDALVAIFPADEDEIEGTATHEVGNFTIKIARKVTRSVDIERLSELGEEYDIDDEIARLFRWKPELNVAVYREESEEMQEFFAQVITTKPARPSITIEAGE